MKAMLDLKSLLLGAVLAVFVLLALGASLNGPSQAGRFQVETSENHVFVIDTATGQVWRKFVVPRQDTRNQEFMDPRLPLDKE